MFFFQIRKHNFLKILKVCLLPEKIRIIGSQLVQHGRDHLCVPAGEDLIHIGLEILDPLGSQRMRKAAYDELLLFT